MTFISGPHSCIGYRFAITEAKALLFTLIRAFEFELGVPEDELASRAFVVQRPFLKKEPGSPQMPLFVKPVGDIELMN